MSFRFRRKQPFYFLIKTDGVAGWFYSRMTIPFVVKGVVGRRQNEAKVLQILLRLLQSPLP